MRGVFFYSSKFSSVSGIVSSAGISEPSDLIGFDGGKLKKLAKNSIHIKTKEDYYGPVEDSHMIIFHLFVHIIKNDISELKDV